MRLFAGAKTHVCTLCTRMCCEQAHAYPERTRAHAVFPARALVLSVYRHMCAHSVFNCVLCVTERVGMCAHIGVSALVCAAGA